MSTILALDLGKFKSVCCFFDTDTQELRYVTVESTAASTSSWASLSSSQLANTNLRSDG
jgi:hypothetical protein